MAKKNLADMFGKGAKKKGAPGIPSGKPNPFAKKGAAPINNPMARPSMAALDTDRDGH